MSYRHELIIITAKHDSRLKFGEEQKEALKAALEHLDLEIIRVERGRFK